MHSPWGEEASDAEVAVGELQRARACRIFADMIDRRQFTWQDDTLYCEDSYGIEDACIFAHDGGWCAALGWPDSGTPLPCAEDAEDARHMAEQMIMDRTRTGE